MTRDTYIVVHSPIRWVASWSANHHNRRRRSQLCFLLALVWSVSAPAPRGSVHDGVLFITVHVTEQRPSARLSVANINRVQPCFGFASLFGPSGVGLVVTESRPGALLVFRCAGYWFVVIDGLMSMSWWLEIKWIKSGHSWFQLLEKVRIFYSARVLNGQ